MNRTPVRRGAGRASASAVISGVADVEASDTLESAPDWALLPARWRDDGEFELDRHLVKMARNQKVRDAEGKPVRPERYEKVEFDYLTVAQRLVWFNKEQRALRLALLAMGQVPVPISVHISIEQVAQVNSYSGETQQVWLATAVVRAVTGDEATMHGSCKVGGWSGGDIEKAETKALGRALGVLGYGTQYGELSDDEDGTFESAVDSPQPTPQGRQRDKTAHAPTTSSDTPQEALAPAQGGTVTPLDPDTNPPTELQLQTINRLLDTLKVDNVAGAETLKRAKTMSAAASIIQKLNARVAEQRKVQQKGGAA